MATPTCPLQLRLYKLVRRAMVIVRYYFKAGMGQRVQWNIVYMKVLLCNIKLDNGPKIEILG